MCSPTSAHTDEQRTLAFVVAGAAFVGLTEVADGNGAVHGGDDLAQGQFVR